RPGRRGGADTRPLDRGPRRHLGARGDAQQDPRAQERRRPAMTPSPALPRAALVTGAGQRIGRAIPLALAADGWAVAIHYRSSRKEAEAVVGQILGSGGRAVALAADLAQESSVEALVPAANAALGPLGCLVNNASLFELDTALTATRAGWDA